MKIQPCDVETPYPISEERAEIARLCDAISRYVTLTQILDLRRSTPHATRAQVRAQRDIIEDYLQDLMDYALFNTMQAPESDTRRGLYETVRRLSIDR